MTRYAGVTPLHYVALHFNMSENQNIKYRLNNICLPNGKDAIYNFILSANYSYTIGKQVINIQVIQLVQQK